MNIVEKIPAIFLIIAVEVVYSRVPMPPNSFQAFRRQAIIQHQPIIHHQTIIQHPPVITRSRDLSTSGTTNDTVVTTSASTTTTTTTEPPELDDDILPSRHTAIRDIFNSDYPYNYNYAPTTYGYDFYGLGFGYNSAGFAGGVSREVEYDFNPPLTRRQQHLKPNHQQSKIKSQASTTKGPTTETSQKSGTVTPELDDDLMTSPATGKAAAHNQETYTGYCFCSPLSQCPVDSMPRGGLCHNFLAYFINLKFIRCCYSPSVARSLQL